MSKPKKDLSPQAFCKSAGYVKRPNQSPKKYKCGRVEIQIIYPKNITRRERRDALMLAKDMLDFAFWLNGFSEDC